MYIISSIVNMIQYTGQILCKNDNNGEMIIDVVKCYIISFTTNKIVSLLCVYCYRSHIEPTVLIKLIFSCTSWNSSTACVM